DVRCDVRAKWAPTSITAGEQHERLLPGVLLLVQLKLERWATPNRRLKLRMLHLVRQLFVRHVVIEPVIPPRGVGRRRADDEQQHGDQPQPAKPCPILSHCALPRAESRASKPPHRSTRHKTPRAPR